MSTFIWVPDQGLTKSVKATVNKSKFGDGYVQRSSDGINSVGHDLKLNFTVRTRVDIDAIDAYLTLQKGVTSFYYTVLGGTALRYTCDAWDTNYMHDGDASLSCTFTRVFEP